MFGSVVGVNNLGKPLTRATRLQQPHSDLARHALATKPEELEVFAAFLGYRGAQPFAEELVRQLGRVEGHYARLFEEAPNLSGPGNLVFTGGEPDPGTVETLEKLGFVEPEELHGVAAWCQDLRRLGFE